MFTPRSVWSMNQNVLLSFRSGMTNWYWRFGCFSSFFSFGFKLFCSLGDARGQHRLGRSRQKKSRVCDSPRPLLWESRGLSPGAQPRCSILEHPGAPALGLSSCAQFRSPKSPSPGTQPMSAQTSTRQFKPAQTSPTRTNHPKPTHTKPNQLKPAGVFGFGTVRAGLVWRELVWSGLSWLGWLGLV